MASITTTHIHGVVKLVKEHCKTEEGEHYLTIRVYGQDSSKSNWDHEFFFHCPHISNKRISNKRIQIENGNVRTIF